MGAKRELGFFDRPQTHLLLSDLGRPRDWTIYVGLGGTIDRTNVSWDSLIEKLFTRRFGVDPANASTAVRKNGPVRAATILETLYESEHAEGDEQATIQLQNDIAQILYGRHRFMAGRLLKSLAEFAYVVARKGHSVAFVTPNYDNYLYQELEVVDKAELAEPAGDQDVSLLGIKAVVEGSGDLGSDWRNPYTISCFHIHGLVEEHNMHQGKPVLGEVSYMRSSSASGDALYELMRQRNVMVVGSSLTDAPLVSALHRSKPLDSSPSLLAGQYRHAKSPRRVVFQPLQSSEWRGLNRTELQGLLALNSKRLDALAVTAVQPDFFGQVGQFVAELQGIASTGDWKQMKSRVYPRRYDKRLDNWWKTWSLMSFSAAVQAKHHRQLSKRLQSIRRTIGASADESLKLEVWARWEPNHDRELALWASSVGTWPDLDSLRKDGISPDSDYNSIKVFCAGSPMFHHEESSSTSRWKSYLGVPIWLELTDGVLPVGVVNLASMFSKDTTGTQPQPATVREENLKNLVIAIDEMAELGRLVLNPFTEDRALQPQPLEGRDGASADAPSSVAEQLPAAEADR